MKEKDQLLYGRWLESRLPSVDERTLVLITGARQTGKTTLAQGKYSGLEFFNLDAMEIRDDLAAIGTYDWARSVGKAVVDEAQKLPSVFEKIKYAFDDGTLDFSVLLGSSQILMGRGISETLAGRVLVYELYPLMLSELAAAGN